MKVFLVFLSVLLVAVLVILLHSNLAITDSQYTVKCGGGNASIVFLADLHDRDFSNGNEELVSRIKKSKPDFICIGGDMINSSADGEDDLRVFVSLAKKLVNIAPVYMVMGNHEMMIDNALLEVYKSKLEELGVVILHNEYRDIEGDGFCVRLYGLDMPLYLYSSDEVMKENGYDYTLDMCRHDFKELDGDKFNILLTHNPKFFETYADMGFDLTLCGHVHGGAVRLPFLGGVFSPDGLFFPKYDAGEFSIGNKKLILSRGLSQNMLFGRFLNPADLVFIELKGDE